MKIFSLKRAVVIITILDVLLAAALIITYVYLMADHLHELEMFQGSKRTQIILYGYVSLTCTLQILVAFQYYQVLTKPREEDEVEEVLHMSRYWMIVSYVLLLNWIVKTGIYARNRQKVAGALMLCLFEVVFRLCSVLAVKIYIHRLRKILKQKMQIKRELKKVGSNGYREKFRRVWAV